MTLIAEEPVYRPPVEASSLILQAILGCPWNKCLFCYLYKTRRLRVRPLSDLLGAVEAAGLYFGDFVSSVFIADSNAVTLRNSYLVPLLSALYRAFPKLGKVSCYGGVRFILKKGFIKLKELSEHGLRKLYIGLESGDDSLLKFMNKGATVNDMVSASDMLQKANIESSVTVILGLAGRGRGIRNAEMTAKAINLMKPQELRIHTLILSPYAPLFDYYLKGLFEEADPREVLAELKMLIEGIDVPVRVYSHASNYVSVSGQLPTDKERMLKIIEEASENPSTLNFERCL